MNSKLTLKLDKKIIEKAKSFARNNDTSLSYLVESYFEKLIQKESSHPADLSPIVKALAGVLKIKNESKIDSLKEQYLMEKYLHE